MTPQSYPLYAAAVDADSRRLYDPELVVGWEMSEDSECWLPVTAKEYGADRYRVDLLYSFGPTAGEAARGAQEILDSLNAS